jgi:hypothetical protein
VEKTSVPDQQETPTFFESPGTPPGPGQWAGIDILTVGFRDNTNTRTGSIYRNGRHQICIDVTVRAVDSAGNWIRPDKNLADRIYSCLVLVERATLRPLVWNYSDNWWFYTDQPNDFVTSPSGPSFDDAPSPHQKYTTGDNGIITYSFYVMCPPSVNIISIGIAAMVRNVPDAEGGFSNQDCAGFTARIPVSAVTIVANEQLPYKRGDINWDYNAATMSDNSGGYNFWLSAKRDGCVFRKFDISGYSGMPGFDGLAGWILGDGYKNFTGVYVWHDYLEVNAWKTVINLSSWHPAIRVYDKGTKGYLCFSWVFNRNNGGTWNFGGPVTYWWQYYTTSVTVYDQFGNSGTFWPDTRNIGSPDVFRLDSSAKENDPAGKQISCGLYSVETGTLSPIAASDQDEERKYNNWVTPKFNIYDYNPN